MKVSSAINQLQFSSKRISRTILKVLNAAIANAENNKQLDIDKLFVKEAFVGKSLRMKRWRPRAKGRAASIIKPFSKVTIVVEERSENKKGKKIMGQKVNPYGIRLGINKTWSSRWFSKNEYTKLLHQDLKIKKYVEKKIKKCKYFKN